MCGLGFGLNQNSGKLSSLRSMIILLSLRGSLGKKFFERGFFERLVGSDGNPLESWRNLSLFVGGDQPRTLFCIIVDPHRRLINTSGGNTTTACVLEIESGRGPHFLLLGV